MGESKMKLAKRQEMLLSCAGVQTMAGRVQVRWDSESTATPMGQLAYFIEFLTLTGLWSRWQESCPHSYHTYLMAGTRLVLGVEVRAGNEHTAKHTPPGLLQILDDLQRAHGQAHAAGAVADP